ncbi:hypothetical protein [Paraburkholderia sp. EG304]|uniref:hypothetical protein n=1 Tax=Paraburkholderia sp. EG304 TaxID=3237015 RepID=UPI003978BE1C
MTTPFLWHVEQRVRIRAAMRGIESSAAAIARWCPPDAIERYVERCTHARQMARLADALVSCISAFGPPAMILGVGDPYGVVAGTVFVALWVVVGLDQCMTHIARTHAAIVAEAARVLSVTAVPPGVQGNEENKI